MYKVNIELAKSSAANAKASQQDSAAMKTVSILGMFFLPGTFVAVRHYPLSVPAPSFNSNKLFGNSTNSTKDTFFNPVGWRRVPSGVFNKGFNIYWAVTLPLTLLVFVFWGVVMLIPWAKWVELFRGRKRVSTDVGSDG